MKRLLAVVALLLSPALALAREPQDSGLAELAIGQAVNGLALSIETSYSFHAQAPVAVGLGALGLTGGIVIPILAFPDVQTGQAMAINFGTELGALNGTLVTMARGTQFSADIARDVAIGQFTGTVLGAALAHEKPPEPGRIALSQSLAMWLGAGTAMVQGIRGEEPTLPALVAADAGALAGYFLWPALRVKRASMFWFDLTVTAGLSVSAIAGSESHNRDLPSYLLGGVLSGAALGTLVVILNERPDDPPPRVNWHVVPQPGGAMLSLGGRL